MTTIRRVKTSHWSRSLKKTLNFGCSETFSFKYLRRTCTVEHIFEIDRNKYLLSRFKQRLALLVAHHLNMCAESLRVKIRHQAVSQTQLNNCVLCGHYYILFLDLFGQC